MYQYALLVDGKWEHYEMLCNLNSLQYTNLQALRGE